MDIEKKPKGIMVVLAGSGERLERVSDTPEEAKAIGKVLKKTQEYYIKRVRALNRRQRRSGG